MEMGKLIHAMRSIHAERQTVAVDPGIAVTFGFPEQLAPLDSDPRVIALDIPSKPQIFMASEVVITPARRSLSPLRIILQDIVVLEAHGYRDAKNVWRFADNTDVVDAALTFNAYADVHGLPRIGLIVSCNSDTTNQGRKAEKVDQLDEAGILYVEQGQALVTNMLDASGRVKILLKTNGTFASTVESFPFH